MHENHPSDGSIVCNWASNNLTADGTATLVGPWRLISASASGSDGRNDAPFDPGPKESRRKDGGKEWGFEVDSNGKYLKKNDANKKKE